MAKMMMHLCYIALFILSNVGRVHVAFITKSFQTDSGPKECVIYIHPENGGSQIPPDGSPYLICVDIEDSTKTKSILRKSVNNRISPEIATPPRYNSRQSTNSPEKVEYLNRIPKNAYVAKGFSPTVDRRTGNAVPLFAKPAHTIYDTNAWHGSDRKGFDLGKEIGRDRTGLRHGANHDSRKSEHGAEIKRSGGRKRRRDKRVELEAGHRRNRKEREHRHEHRHRKEQVGRKSAHRNGESHRKRRNDVGYGVNRANRRNYRVGYGAGYGYTAPGYVAGRTGYSIVNGLPRRETGYNHIQYRNLPTVKGERTQPPVDDNSRSGYGVGYGAGYGVNGASNPITQSHAQATGANTEAVANALREKGQGMVLANSNANGDGAQTSAAAINQGIGGADAFSQGYGTGVNAGSFATSQNSGNTLANTLVNGANTNALGNSQANQGHAISNVHATGSGSSGQATSESMGGMAVSNVLTKGENSNGVSAATSQGPHLAHSYTNVAGANSIGTATSHNFGGGQAVAHVTASGPGSNAIASAFGRKNGIVKMSSVYHMRRPNNYFNQGHAIGSNLGPYSISYGSGYSLAPAAPVHGQLG